MQKVIDPAPGTFRRTLGALPEEEPVVMLNLLRFKAQADPVDGEAGRTGAQAYARYGELAAPHLERVGAEIVWRGTARGSVIAPEGEAWDEVLLVRYPSPQAFVAMVTDPAYQALARHRTAALEDARLVAMTED